MLKSVRKLRILLCVSLLVGCRTNSAAQISHVETRADTARFYDWWTSMVNAAQALPLPPGVRRESLPLTRLRAAPEHFLAPEEMQGSRPHGFILASVGKDTLVLWVPMDSAEIALGVTGCVAHTARLSVSHGRRSVAVQANPHCSEVYGPEEVDFGLYWLEGDRWPLVEVITNHPDHVPFFLYAFSPPRSSYVLVREGRFTTVIVLTSAGGGEEP